MTDQVNKYGVNRIGLKHKDTYDDVLDIINTSKDTIKYPDRRAKQLRNSPYLSFLDGEGLEHMKEQQINAIKEQHKDDLIRAAGMSSSNSSNSAIESRIQSSAASSRSSRSYMSADGEPQQFDLTIDDTMEDVEQEINIALDAQAENEEAKREKIIHILQTHLGQEVLSGSTIQFAHRMAGTKGDSPLAPPQTSSASASASSSDLKLSGPTPFTDPETSLDLKRSGPTPDADDTDKKRGRPLGSTNKKRDSFTPPWVRMPEPMMIGNEGSQIRRPAPDDTGNGNKKNKTE